MFSTCARCGSRSRIAAASTSPPHAKTMRSEDLNRRRQLVNLAVALLAMCPVTLHHLAQVHRALVAATFARPDERLHMAPFLIRQIARIPQFAAVVPRTVLDGCKVTGHIASKATARFTSCRLRLRSSDRIVLACGGEVLAAAILDRLLHRAHVLNIKGRSYRLRNLEDALKLSHA